MRRALFLSFLLVFFIGCVEEIPLDQIEQETFNEGNVNAPIPVPVPEIPKDITAPKIVSSFPSGTLPETTKSILLQVMTDEIAKCQYDLTDKLYSLMLYNLPTTTGLNHNVPVNVNNDQSYKFYIRCEDEAGNASQSSTVVSFSIDKLGVQDIIPPVIGGLAPSGKLFSGTTSAVLSLSSNEGSICKYSGSSTASFDQMMLMSSNNGLLHTSEVTGLSDGSVNQYYFYCKDLVGNLSLKANLSFEVEKLSLDGKALYATNCMNCHGVLENSSKQDRTAAVIQNAINNSRSMKDLAYLKALQPLQVQAIAEALKVVSPDIVKVGFKQSISAIEENKALAVVSIKLNEPSKKDTSVEYFVKGGTAIQGEDFEFFAGKINFLSGEQEKSFTVGLTNDQKVENSETIIFGLKNPVDLQITGLTEHTLTLLDDDQAAPVEIKANFTDFTNLLSQGKCLTCHDKPGFGDFAVLTDLNNPIASERAWYFAKSNDGTQDYIVPGKPEESLIYTRWRKLEDDGSITGNMPGGAHTALVLTIEERKKLEAYIRDIKIDQTTAILNTIPSFKAINIGNSQGSKVDAADSIELQTNSDDLGSTKENFYFNYLRVYGNFELSARIDVLSNEHQYAKAGLAIRESLDAQAIRSTGNYLNKQNAVFIHNRSQTAGATVYEQFADIAAPTYLKMTRSGIKITYSVKTNKYAPWKNVVSYDLPMDELSYIGFSLSSSVVTNTIKARFSEINFKGTLVGDSNLSDAEIKQALINNTADFSKIYDYGEKIDLSKIDPSLKFERFQAVTQTYCMSCHDGADPVARDFSSYITEQDWLNMKDLSGSNLAIIKGSAKDSYIYKFLRHNQMTGTPASMPKNADGYKAEYTKYVADWINSFAIEEGSIAQSCATVESLPAPSVIRRISHDEYNNAIGELFGLTGDYSSLIPVSPDFMGYDRVGGAGLLANQSYYSKIGSAATDVVTDLFNGQGKLGEKFNCSEASSDSCHLNYLKRIAKHAFRKSLSAEHNTSLTTIFNKAKEVGLGKIEGTKAGLEYILTHPNFHFVIFEDGANKSVRNMSNLELLSQISFFLWSSIPDEADLNAVISGGLNLQSAIQLESFIDKMLQDVRAKAFAKDFTNQWLELEKVQNFSSANYPQVDTAMKNSMQEESKRLFEFIFDQERPFTELITADYTFLDQRLADHYKFTFNTGSTFNQYNYRPEDKRSGILSHASFLAITSDSNDSRPTVRGKFVIDRIMCGELFDLPGGGVEQVQSDPTTPFRDTVIEHSKSASCAGCHQIMDPIGLGLESFDQAGVYRTVYAANRNNQTVDSQGSLYMKDFKSVPELTNVIKEQNAFNKCLTEQLMVYGTGIKLNTKYNIADKCEVEDIYKETLDGKMSLRELLKKIILSDSFRKRDLR